MGKADRFDLECPPEFALAKARDKGEKFKARLVRESPLHARTYCDCGEFVGAPESRLFAYNCICVDRATKGGNMEPFNPRFRNFADFCEERMKEAA